MNDIYIGLDIDHTVIEHCYPEMDGRPIGALPWLLHLQNTFPVKYLINSMRSGLPAVKAKAWLVERGIKVYGINQHPTQATWTTSPKTYCHLYIDDRGAGTPLTDGGYIDWEVHGPQVVKAVQRIAARAL